jgi:TRAP-type mannitol/chloroaromatic compound transport system permease small subunit
MAVETPNAAAPPRMRALLAFARGVDRVSASTGAAAAWLVLLMTLLGAGNALLRWLGRQLGVQLASNAYIELQWYLFTLVFLLPAAWALEQGSHVRVDVFHSRLSPRLQTIFDAAGHVLLLLPFIAATLWLSWPSVRASLAVREGSPDPGGLPRYPLKAVLLLGLGLLFVQGVAELIKDVARLRGLLPLRHRSAATAEEGV